MLEELGWLCIPKRLMFNEAILTRKTLNKLTPTCITDLLKPMPDSHSLSLRSLVNALLSIPISRTALYDFSFSYSASKLWNSLPKPQNVISLSEFKTGLKDYV